MTSSVTGAIRCALGARARGDAMSATAPPARRFVLLEMPGPWGPEALPHGGLGLEVAHRVRAAAARVGARPLLIRRPGRHAISGDGPRRRGIVSVASGVRWGTWRHDDELPGVDLGTAFADLEAAGPSEPDRRPLVLVCTQGRHDLCCAVEGRPVVAVAAADPRLEVWECSHLGGDRFAANLLWLPAGLLFGGLDAATTAPVLAAALEGRAVLEHFRGRCGDPLVEQAAAWHLMKALGDDRPDRIEVESVVPSGPAGDRVTVTAGHRGRRLRLELERAWTEPQHLTCRATGDGRVRVYHLTSGPEPA